MITFLLVLVVVVGLGGASAYLPANKYNATALLIVEINAGADPSSAVAALQLFLPQLAIEAQYGPELKKVAATVPAKYAQYAVSVGAVADPQSGTMTITATSANPAAAAAFVNADARQLASLEKRSTYYTLVDPSPAPIPDTPSNPRKEILLGSLAFGFIAAVFAAMGVDAVRRRLSQVEETRSRIGLPVLAEVPRVGRQALTPGEVFRKGSHPLILEAFQELRSNLLLALPADRPAAIAVTSGNASEGKSSIASDLAWALASESRLVTAVDCDLRKPTMHLLLGTTLGPGVSGRRSLDLDQVLCTTDNPYLSVIPAGIPDRHPVDIISDTLPPLLEDLRAEGRHIVVDCPPLEGVAETLMVASIVDVVVFVVDARHFDPELVQQHQSRLQEAGATVVGVVLNRVRTGNKKWDRSYGYAVPEFVDASQISVQKPSARSSKQQAKQRSSDR
jgi:capsular exopolysaccharide synthesis family protein